MVQLHILKTMTSKNIWVTSKQFRSCVYSLIIRMEAFDIWLLHARSLWLIVSLGRGEATLPSSSILFVEFHIYASFFQSYLHFRFIGSIESDREAKNSMKKV